MKVSLAFALSQIRRVSADADKIAAAEAETIRICSEAADTCGSMKTADDALFLLARLYQDVGEFTRADDCLELISAESFDSRIIGLVNLLGQRKEYRRQRRVGEEALWRLAAAAKTVCALLSTGMQAEDKNREALTFLEAQEHVLSIFDLGCPDFCIAGKTMVCVQKARAYMLLGDKKRCLTELRRFFELAEQVRKTAENCDDFHVAV